MYNTPIIQHCYKVHLADMGGQVNFTFEQYALFWLSHHRGDIYSMKNRDGSVEKCKVAYYPLPNHKDLRALVEIEIPNGTDFREVPVHFLVRQ